MYALVEMRIDLASFCYSNKSYVGTVMRDNDTMCRKTAEKVYGQKEFYTHRNCKLRRQFILHKNVYLK